MNLYGHGGDALPIDNALPRPLDLVPVPIEMVDDGDAQFDGSDHFIFMGDGPDRWTYDDGSGRWRHDINPWSDTAWYFLRVDDVVPVGVPTEPGLGGDVDAVLTATDFHQYHELEQSTIIRSGRNFFGEVFDQNPTHTIPFQVPDILPEPARLEVRLMGRSVGMASPYTVSLGDSLWTILPPVTGSQTYVSQARVGTGDWLWTPSSELVQVGITLDAQAVDAKGWLDYVRITGAREANMSGGSQQEFVRAAEAAPGRIVRWNVGGAQSVQRVWDVTDPQAPRAIPHEVVDGVLSFQVAYDEVRRFRAGTGSGFYTPVPIGPVQNTDVHALPQVDLVVITPPALREAADSLARIHLAEGLDVAVLEPSFIYDCFSSGRVDPTAFKMLMKMLHDRAEGNPDLEPRYLQLFGDGTFRNRNLPRLGNALITFQSAQSHTPTTSYVTDDYFGFLSDAASERLTDTLSIGVGRIPASTPDQAWDAVAKVVAYSGANPDPEGRVHHVRSAGRRGGQSIWSLAQPRVLRGGRLRRKRRGDRNRPHALQHRPRSRGGGEPRRLRHRAHLHGRLPATGNAGGRAVSGSGGSHRPPGAEWGAPRQLHRPWRRTRLGPRARVEHLHHPGLGQPRPHAALLRPPASWPGSTIRTSRPPGR